MQQEIFKNDSLFWLYTDNKIIFDADVARAVGSVNSAIVLAAIANEYRKRRDLDQLTPDGFFYYTQENLEEKTALSRHEQDKALKTLLEKDLIKKKVEGLPAKRFFKIDQETIKRYFFGRIGLEKAEIRKEMPPQLTSTSLPKTGKLDCRDSTNQFVENRQEIDTLLLKSYVKESKSESKEAPPTTRHQPLTASNQQGSENSIAPSALPAGQSIPFHKEKSEEKPKKRNQITQEEWNSPAMKEFLEMTDDDKLKPYFKDFIMAGWLRKWGVYMVVDTIKYFLKTKEKQDKKGKPILNPEAWMESAFKDEYAKAAQTREENEVFAKKIKKQYRFSTLELKDRYCIDTSTTRDCYYSTPSTIFQECLLSWVKRFQQMQPDPE